MSTEANLSSGTHHLPLVKRRRSRNVNLSFTLFNLYSFNILQLLVNFLLNLLGFVSYVLGWVGIMHFGFTNQNFQQYILVSTLLITIFTINFTGLDSNDGCKL